MAQVHPEVLPVDMDVLYKLDIGIGNMAERQFSPSGNLRYCSQKLAAKKNFSSHRLQYKTIPVKRLTGRLQPERRLITYLCIVDSHSHSKWLTCPHVLQK